MTSHPSLSELAQSERGALCDLFLRLGPDAPTLCGGWTARDLAAHLAIREARPDASLGIVGPLKGWTRRVQDGYAARPWEELVAAVRNGPPLLSVFRLPGADGLLNTMEYYVHHEDVRRGGPEWEPRHLAPALQAALWRNVRQSAAGLMRKVPVGTTLVRTDDGGGTVRATGGEPAVVVSGTAGELALVMFGRDRARVEVTGDPEAVEAFRSARRGV